MKTKFFTLFVLAFFSMVSLATPKDPTGSSKWWRRLGFTGLGCSIILVAASQPTHPPLSKNELSEIAPLPALRIVKSVQIEPALLSPLFKGQNIRKFKLTHRDGSPAIIRVLDERNVDQNDKKGYAKKINQRAIDEGIDISPDQEVVELQATHLDVEQLSGGKSKVKISFAPYKLSMETTVDTHQLEAGECVEIPFMPFEIKETLYTVRVSTSLTFKYMPQHDEADIEKLSGKIEIIITFLGTTPDGAELKNLKGI